MWKRLKKHLQQTPNIIRDIENDHPQNDTECLREMVKRLLEQPKVDMDKLRYFVKNM